MKTFPGNLPLALTDFLQEDVSWEHPPGKGDFNIERFSRDTMTDPAFLFRVGSMGASPHGLSTKNWVPNLFAL